MVRRFALLTHDTEVPHHDLVLDVGGALRCWRLTEEPSLDAGSRQPAIELAPRPLDYLDFAGLALALDCGDGRIGLADQGRLHNHSFDGRGARSELADALDAGAARLWLEGSWLQGGWDLVRHDGRWELVKVSDLVARARASLQAQPVG